MQRRKKTQEQIRIEEALKAFKRGWVLTPLRGKKPILKAWQKQDPPDLETVKKWARKGNIGLRTGEVSGVVVIDDDTADGSGAKTLGLPKTTTVVTGSERRHYYFKPPAKQLKNWVGKLAKDVDIRCDGGQVVFPGSLHPETGEPYYWAPGLSPEDAPLAMFPAHLVIRNTKKGRPRAAKRPRAARTQPSHSDMRRAEIMLRESCETIRLAANGERNDTLNREMFRLGGIVRVGLLDRCEVENQARKAAEDAGLEEDEIPKTIQSGLTAGMEENDSNVHDLLYAREGRLLKHLTDTGNAERLVELHGDNLRYCSAWKKWLAWDGRRWKPVSDNLVLSKTKDLIHQLYAESKECDDADSSRAIKVWAKRTESSTQRRAIIKLAQCEKGISIRLDELDCQPFALNCQNGTLQLESGKLGAHRREDYLTKIVDVDYVPEAKCSHWEAFLQRVLPNAQVRRYIQRAIGYSLSGDVSEQVFFLCYGEGANGKSTLFGTLTSVLGKDFAIQMAPEVLLAKRQRNHPTEQADLFGKRMALTGEIGQNVQLDEPLVKQLTGGDSIRARRMREDFWEFKPTHHLWLSTNQLPKIQGTDEAIWRRVVVIRFPVEIPNKERDRKLVDKLSLEREGILAWAVKGFKDWQARGLCEPTPVQQETKAYRFERDVLARFLMECVVDKKGAGIGATKLHDSYRVWCEDHDEDPMTQREFGKRLGQAGYKKKKSDGRMIYQNLTLN